MNNIQIYLNNLKSIVDKFDAHNLIPVPIDLSKLSNVVKSDIVKKYVYNANTKNIEDKILHIINLATKTTLDAKFMRLKVKYQILMT